jgi:hypothetical protein
MERFLADAVPTVAAMTSAAVSAVSKSLLRVRMWLNLSLKRPGRETRPRFL